MTRTVILPSCDDGNRGDQALVWQTRNIASRAGLADECLMLAEDPSNSPQSKAEGIESITPILRHPSARFSPRSNMRYGKLLTIIWGIISVLDGARSFLFLSRTARHLFAWLLSPQERRTIREIAQADACFVKGGGFIHTTKSVTDPYRAYFFLYHILLAQSLGTPVYVMPNSFGPLEGRIYRWIVKRALSRCALVTTRESISAEVLRELGIAALEFPDLAFGLERADPEQAYFTDFRRAMPARALVGITARPYRFPGSANPAESYRRYVDEMAKFASAVYANGYFPIFIEHVVALGEHESDISAIRAITSLLRVDEYAVFSRPELNCRAMKSVYTECDYVVGTRFHSVIFALSEGVPAMAIGYGGNKGHGIMKDIGMPDMVTGIDEFRASEAGRQFERLVEGVEFADRIARLGDEARDQLDGLVRVIKERSPLQQPEQRSWF